MTLATRQNGPGRTPFTCDSVAYTGGGGKGATAMMENRGAAASGGAGATRKPANGPGCSNCRRPRAAGERGATTGRDDRCASQPVESHRSSEVASSDRRASRLWPRRNLITEERSMPQDVGLVARAAAALFEAGGRCRRCRLRTAATLAVLQTGGRPLHAVRRTGDDADANRVRRRQSEGAALLPGRSAGGGRRPAGRAVRRPRRATARTRSSRPAG